MGTKCFKKSRDRSHQKTAKKKERSALKAEKANAHLVVHTDTPGVNKGKIQFGLTSPSSFAEIRNKNKNNDNLPETSKNFLYGALAPTSSSTPLSIFPTPEKLTPAPRLVAQPHSASVEPLQSTKATPAPTPEPMYPPSRAAIRQHMLKIMGLTSFAPLGMVEESTPTPPIAPVTIAPPPAAAVSQRKEFNAIVRDLKDLAVPHLEKHVRRQIETSKLRAIGASIGKREKTPLPTLLRRKERVKEILKAKAQEEAVLGVTLTERKFYDVHEAVKEKRAKVQRTKANKVKRRFMK